MNNIEFYGFVQGGWSLTEVNTTANGQTIYQGKCGDSTGSKSAAVWCIKRIVITNGDGVQTIEEKFADGNMQYDNIWNNRASLTYKYL